MDFIACSKCFTDRGLQLDAEQIGEDIELPCPICGRTEGKKLDRAKLHNLAYRFFVWGSFWRTEYGGAPQIQFNEHQKTSITPSSWLQADIALIEKILGIGFFRYGPRLWMVGEIEPLKLLQNEGTRLNVIQRIIEEYPSRKIEPSFYLYRIRKEPKYPDKDNEYDSPPESLLGSGRLDTAELPIHYSSPDLEVCVHECKFMAEDDLYVATLAPSRNLRVLNLSALLEEHNRVTEFESLDLAVHMLFLAGSHSYEISRDISTAAYRAGFDGLIYPSYFSLLRSGVIPLRTSYGLSHRIIPQFKSQEQSLTVPNLAIFGRPVEDGRLIVKCINRLVINRVSYGFHFGPASF